MIKIALLITETINDFSFIEQKIEALSLQDFQIEVFFVLHQEFNNDAPFTKSKNINYNTILYPEDEDLLFRDILQKMQSDYLISFSPEIEYPNNFISQLFFDQKPKEQAISSERAPYTQRLLKAMQQSKYGLGIVKQDIKREYPELSLSGAYKISKLTKLSIQELEVDESFAMHLNALAIKSAIKPILYLPDYKDIEYYLDKASYFQGVKQQAPSLSYKNKPNAIGLPLYMMIFIVISLFAALIFPPALIFLLVMSALYLLALTLESLAITTIKKQGDLFLGLLFMFMGLHFYYMISYLTQVNRK